MALSAADVGELRRRIQCGEITVGEEGGKKVRGALIGELNRLATSNEMTPGEARVYELMRTYYILAPSHIFGGHNKQYIDAQLGNLQETMEQAEEEAKEK